MAAPRARADGPRGGRVECRRPPRAEAAHVRRPRAPPMLSAGHGHDCFCASRWPRAAHSRAVVRMVALLPRLACAGSPPSLARGVCESFYARARLDHRCCNSSTCSVQRRAVRSARSLDRPRYVILFSPLLSYRHVICARPCLCRVVCDVGPRSIQARPRPQTAHPCAFQSLATKGASETCFTAFTGSRSDAHMRDYAKLFSDRLASCRVTRCSMNNQGSRAWRAHAAQRRRVPRPVP